MNFPSQRTAKGFQIVWFISITSSVAGIESLSGRLVKDLWRTYQADVRPICKSSFPSPVDVQLAVSVRQIIDVAEKQMKITASLWLRQNWNDCRLTWDPSKYGSISRITVPSERVWLPDIALYENVQKTLGDRDYTRATVFHNGTVTFHQPLVMVFMCNLDVSMFPFDVQVCDLTVGSWMYPSIELNLTLMTENAVDLRSFLQNGEWDLAEMKAREKTTYDTMDRPFGSVVFTLRLVRKPLFFVIILILPPMLIVALAIVGFILPPASGEKLALEVTVLLSLLVFQFVIIKHLPSSSDTNPHLSTFLLAAMVMLTLSSACTVVVLNLHFAKRLHPLPEWTRSLLTGRLGHLFGVAILASRTFEKYQQLIDEATREAPYRVASPAYPSIKSLSPKPVGMSYTNDKATRLSTISCRSTREKDEEEDDSVYGFTPDRLSPASVRGRTQSRPGSPKSPATLPTSPTSWPGMPRSGDTRQSLWAPDVTDSPALLLHKRVLRVMEQLNQYKDDKRLMNSLENQWKVFAIFLDRIFLCIFFTLGMTAMAAILIKITS